MPRDYRKEYDNYQSRPEQRNNRSSRNKARRKMTAAGRASKGDGKDVHHKDSNPRNNSSKNLTIMGRSSNRRRKK
jgi:hypothetical protein